MTTSALPPISNDDDDGSAYDDDSAYDTPAVPSSTAIDGDETVVNESEDKARQLDSILDAEEDQHNLETTDKSEHACDNDGQFDDEDDLRFDSDEQPDVESIASTDDEASAFPNTHSEQLASDDMSVNKPDVEDVSTEINTRRSSSASSCLPPSSSNPSSSSLFLRASQTFYKTFLKRKTASTDRCLDTQTPTETKSASRLKQNARKCSAETTRKHRTKSDGESECPDEKLQRLCQLLDAQLSALAGAKTGFVQLRLLRPLAEQTLHAVDIDARGLLTEYGEAEAEAQRARNEVIAAQKRGEEEIMRKERLLVEAKVALAEAHGDVERLRGELASAKRALADPNRRIKGQRRKAEAVRRETVACREARAAVEEKLAERRRSLDREHVELSRLEKEYRDIEGDWT